MGIPRSPFLVIDEFISPLTCEDFISRLRFEPPQHDVHNNTFDNTTKNVYNESIINTVVERYIPKINIHYNVVCANIQHGSFHHHPQGCNATPLVCENSTLKTTWERVKDYDFSCVLFLTEYQNAVPFDSDYEVYGGKLEFMSHGFGFTPKRGNAIIYPSGPNFVNNISEILCGDLYYAKFHITTTVPYVYNRKSFPGDYRSWFENIA